LLLVDGEETSALTRSTLGTELQIQVVVRAKVENAERDTVLALREFCELLFYFWAPPRARRVAGVDRVWLKTTVDVPFDPVELKTTRLFFALATLSFGITR